jgi:hypothetical protein
LWSGRCNPYRADRDRGETAALSISRPPRPLPPVLPLSNASSGGRVNGDPGGPASGREGVGYRGVSASKVPTRQHSLVRRALPDLEVSAAHPSRRALPISAVPGLPAVPGLVCMIHAHACMLHALGSASSSAAVPGLAPISARSKAQRSTSLDSRRVHNARTETRGQRGEDASRSPSPPVFEVRVRASRSGSRVWLRGLPISTASRSRLRGPPPPQALPTLGSHAPTCFEVEGGRGSSRASRGRAGSWATAGEAFEGCVRRPGGVRGSCVLRALGSIDAVRCRMTRLTVARLHLHCCGRGARREGERVGEEHGT